MYFLDQTIKQDPVRRWHLPDRIFFGHGACHILAGVYREMFASSDFLPVWLVPRGGTPGNHIFVTDGKVAFDYRGYVPLDRLLNWYQSGWRTRYPGWTADLVEVSFDLLDTQQLNQRNLRGLDQYLHDPRPRAERFITRRGRHPAGVERYATKDSSLQGP